MHARIQKYICLDKYDKTHKLFLCPVDFRQELGIFHENDSTGVLNRKACTTRPNASYDLIIHEEGVSDVCLPLNKKLRIYKERICLLRYCGRPRKSMSFKILHAVNE